MAALLAILRQLPSLGRVIISPWGAGATRFLTRGKAYQHRTTKVDKFTVKLSLAIAACAILVWAI